MADTPNTPSSKNTDTPSTGTPMTGKPSTGKPSTGKPTADAAPELDASIEPATQIVSSMATDTMETPRPVSPPIPADYEMPDDYAAEGGLDKVKAWAEAHPGLAVLAAAGTGLLVGRIVTGLFPDRDPSLADRVEKKAKVLRKQAKKKGKVYKKDARSLQKDASAYADDAGDALQDALDKAMKALNEATGTAGDYAEEGYEKTKDFAEHIGDVVKVALTGALASKVNDWVKR